MVTSSNWGLQGGHYVSPLIVREDVWDLACFSLSYHVFCVWGVYGCIGVCVCVGVGVGVGVCVCVCPVGIKMTKFGEEATVSLPLLIFLFLAVFYLWPVPYGTTGSPDALKTLHQQSNLTLGHCCNMTLVQQWNLTLGHCCNMTLVQQWNLMLGHCCNMTLVQQRKPNVGSLL